MYVGITCLLHALFFPYIKMAEICYIRGMEYIVPCLAVASRKAFPPVEEDGETGESLGVTHLDTPLHLQLMLLQAGVGMRGWRR